MPVECHSYLKQSRPQLVLSRREPFLCQFLYSRLRDGRTFVRIIVLYILSIYWRRGVRVVCVYINMANVALLAQHSFSGTSTSYADQPEIACRRREVEKAVDVCDGVGLFRGSLLADGVLSRRSAESGTGNSRAGSCRASSSSKHFRSSSSADPITPDELASLVAADGGTGSDVTCRSVVVVDCRTFLAFNTNHVAGAFNASCGDRISKKRLTQGRATVADLVSGGGPSSQEVGAPREAYRRLAEMVASSPTGLFVSYDDYTDNMDSLQESHPLRLLTTALTGSGYRTKFLAGECLFVV